MLPTTGFVLFCMFCYILKLRDRTETTSINRIICFSFFVQSRARARTLLYILYMNILNNTQTYMINMIKNFLSTSINFSTINFQLSTALNSHQKNKKNSCFLIFFSHNYHRKCFYILFIYVKQPKTEQPYTFFILINRFHYRVGEQ